MPDTPWLDDACSLVDAFRKGDRSPVDELEACLAAIDASDRNAFTHLDTATAPRLRLSACCLCQWPSYAIDHVVESPRTADCCNW